MKVLTYCGTKVDKNFEVGVSLVNTTDMEFSTLSTKNCARTYFLGDGPYIGLSFSRHVKNLFFRVSMFYLGNQKFYDFWTTLCLDIENRFFSEL